MNGLLDALRSVAGTGDLVAVPLAFASGVVASLNPCCVPLYPAAAATCSAGHAESPTAGLRLPTAFVGGVAAATAILGILAALAGRALTGLGGWASYAIAVVPIAMGLHLLGWIRIPMPAASGRARVKGVAGAFASGLLLSLVLAPCGTPILAAVLSFAAHEQSPAYGALLLFAYGLGVGLPMLLVGTAANGLARWLDRVGKSAWADRLAGGTLLALGFYLLWIG